MKMNKKCLVTATLLLTAAGTWAADIKGLITDATTHEALIGATIQIEGTSLTAVSDIDGKFAFTGVSDAKAYTLIIKYVSYKTKKIDGVQAKEQPQEMKIAMQPDEQTLQGVTVTGVAKKNTEIAVIQMAKNSPVIVSNVSAQEIQKTQDSNAGEVIRRVPGVSLIDDKFVMVRGLSQRYNNVWINGGAAPSSEADSRAFSFDLIPSSQIDNMEIVKTPSPEYPADYTGGFINITTKDIPSANTADISVGGNWNTKSAFSSFLYSDGSATDFLGFDNGKRSLSGGINTPLKTLGSNGIDLQGNGLNNNWLVKNRKPIGDLKLSASIGRRWNIGNALLGMIAAANYTNEYRTFEGMTNNLFGVYDTDHDRSNYLRRSTDDQYNHNVRLGAMLNFTLLSANGRNKYQLKNIFNQIGNDRYTWREGINAQSDNEHAAEYYYRSRTTYNGQITGKHTLAKDQLDWSASYSFANRNVPDRKRYTLNDKLAPNDIQLTASNDINREWTQLDEHIMSAAINDKHDFVFGSWTPSLKLGGYGEYRTRKYTTRNFIYNWNPNDNQLPDDFQHMDITQLLSNSNYFGLDKLYMLEEQHMRNNYKGHNTLGAGYFAATLPFGKLSVYAGLRYEYDHMELITNTSDYKPSPLSHNYTYNDLFPSVNLTYRFTDQHQLRLSYGKTVNRPEFREMSPSVFYDFDLVSDVQGNTGLKPCYIQNVDLRYEFYPSKGETVSLAAFYKHFDDPIEWTYTVTGGTDLVYSYLNAQSAKTYGLELDIRKDLSFIGLKGFSWSFNGSLIKSRVDFPSGSKEADRPMQGQSPYLINTGLFYKNGPQQIDVALLYNRIGKRIIGVGRSEGSTSGNEVLRVPDSYEMPRNVIDLSLAKRFGQHWELKLNVRDLLAEKVYYKQFETAHFDDGHTKKIEQVTRCYQPGRNVALSVGYKF